MDPTRSYEARGAVAAPPEILFEHLDDPHRLSSHMERRSMAMMGSTMVLDTDALGGRAVGSVIRMRGRMLGIPLALEETVTGREPPWSKAWETNGEPQLVVIGAYRMGFRIAPAPGGSQLAVFIAYTLPSRRWQRVLGRLFAGSYARWCCERMLADAVARFKPGSSRGDAAAPGTTRPG